MDNFTELLWVPWIDPTILERSDARYSDPEGAPFGLRPDIPAGIGYKVIDGAYHDNFSSDKNICTHMLIAVSSEGKKAITNAVSYENLPERTKFATMMNLECKDNWNNNTSLFFGNIQGIDSFSTLRKRMLRKLLAWSVQRGLKADKAQAILEKHGLPSDETKEGIDSDLYNAALYRESEKRTTTKADAERFLKSYLRKKGHVNNA